MVDLVVLSGLASAEETVTLKILQYFRSYFK
jgi:hypothetical protein